MASIGFDNYLINEQAKKEHWHEGPYCEDCGTSLKGCYAYNTPEGLFCENCADELLEQYKREWEVDADEWRYSDE